jgi:hypothetical protein
MGKVFLTHPWTMCGSLPKHISQMAPKFTPVKNFTTDMVGENVFVCTWEEDINGQTVRMKEKGTIFYPLGVAYEFVEGPLRDQSTLYIIFPGR